MDDHATTTVSPVQMSSPVQQKKTSIKADAVSFTTVTVSVTVSVSATPEASFMAQLISSGARDKRTIQILAVTVGSILAMAMLYIAYRVRKKVKARDVRPVSDRESHGAGWVPRETLTSPGTLISFLPSRDLPHEVSTTSTVQQTSLYRSLAVTSRPSVTTLPSSPFVGGEEHRMLSLTSNRLVHNGGMSAEDESLSAPAPTPVVSRTTHDSTGSDSGSSSTPPSYRSIDNARGGKAQTLDPFADPGTYASARSQGNARPPASPRTTSLDGWTDNGTVGTPPSYHSFAGVE